MDGQLGDANQRLWQAHQATHQAAIGIAKDHAPGQLQIAIQPRIEQRAAIYLDPQLQVAVLFIDGLGL